MALLNGPLLWLALRGGLVTILPCDSHQHWQLWLALRGGLVTIFRIKYTYPVQLWLALRGGLVTITEEQVQATTELGKYT